MPADYKEEYPWLKEVDSLALANAQLNLQTAYKNFFRDKSVGFPKFKSKHHDRKVSDEVHQLFVPGRGAQVKDVIIDSAGAVVGIGVYIFVNGFTGTLNL